MKIHKDRIPDEKRYKINPKTGCWIYTLSIDKGGYGVFHAKGERKSLRAHRYFYEKYRGPIPKGLDIDHLCRNRNCVNPDHLEPVTRSENIKRGVKNKSWAKMFENFYDKNKEGGSSRWLVSPQTVELFILQILKDEKRNGYQKGVHETKLKIYKKLDNIK